MDDLPTRAVSLAIEGNWKEAEALNRKILLQSPKDIEALNRLARSLAEQGKISEAIKISKKVVRIDRANSIANKCIEKWMSLGKKKVLGVTSATFLDNGFQSAPTFIEEPGKTKLVSLIHLGDSAVLGQLNTGDEVILEPHQHRVSVTTQNGLYIGRLPDDLATKLIKLLKLEHEYQVLIVSVGEGVKIFIREVSRGEKYQNIVSFPIEKSFYSSDQGLDGLDD